MTETMELGFEELGLVKSEPLNAVQVFTGGGMNAILDGIEKTVRSISLDASTADGRDQIRSVAYKVVRTKTQLDAEGKKLTEEWRKQTALVNTERKKSTERLEALAEEVRKPLTEFEAKEKTRVAGHETALAEMSGCDQMLHAYPDMDLKLLAEHLRDFTALHAGRDWEEFADRATKLRREVSMYLIGRIESRKKHDADQAELARLRQEEADRLQRERDERLKAEAAEAARVKAEKEAAEAAETERQRVAAEAERVQREHERQQQEADTKLAKEKADRRAAEAFSERKRQDEEDARKLAEKRAKDAEDARIASELKAETDRKAAEVKAASDLKAAQEKAKREVDAAAQRERDKIEKERKEAETARLKREADEANKARIRAEIIGDLAFMDIEMQADAILAGKIRNVRVVW